MCGRLRVIGNNLGVLSSIGATKEQVALARKEISKQVKGNRDAEEPELNLGSVQRARGLEESF